MEREQEMFKRLVIGLAVVGLASAGIMYVVGQGQPDVVQAATAPVYDPVEADDEIVAEAEVVPQHMVVLSFSSGGIVDKALAKEGTRVEANQVIARLDSERQEAMLAEAQAALVVAEARLAKAQVGPDERDVASVGAAVTVAEADVQSARAAAEGARANLALAQAGADVEEIAIAEKRVEQSKNALWAAQAQRDAICGRVGRGAQSADCDAAEAAVHTAEHEVEILGLQAQYLKTGPSADRVASAQAQLDQALGQVARAEAQVKRAQADLVRAKVGPLAGDVAVAEAQLEQARASVKKAFLAVTETELRSPIAGTLVAMDTREGQYSAPGAAVVIVADLGSWQLETTDLSELNIVRVEPGDPVLVTFDAIPDLELKGTVARIKGLGEMRRGEIAYTVIITPHDPDPRLRWKMTAAVTITPSE